jgi:hypothetical protein
MSRELRILIASIAGVVVLYFVIGSILPRQWQEETTMRIPAPPSRVVPLLADFGKWQQWSAISATARADTRVDVEGPPASVGHQLAWRTGDNQAMLRLSRVGDDGVAYDFLTALGAGSELRAQGHGEVRVTPDADGSVVHWRDTSSVDGLTERWFAWFGAQQDAARRFQEASLAGLKVAVEAK